MTNQLQRKLLLVADSKIAKFYLAENFKIKSLMKEITSKNLKIHHNRQEKKTGRFAKSGSNSRFFDPHSEAKDLDRQDFCKSITHTLLKLLAKTKYDQLILVCGPKMLGDIRNDFPAKFKNMDVKEFTKELAHENVSQLEKHVLDKLKFK